MHLRFVVLDPAAHLTDHHRGQQEPLLPQGFVHLRWMHPLLQQHHIEQLTPLLQLLDRIGQGAEILQLITTALQPAATGPLHARIRQQRGNREGGL